MVFFFFFFSKLGRVFEKAVVRCLRFDGVTKTNIIDDKVFGGPLMQQYNNPIMGEGKIDVRYEIKVLVKKFGNT